MLNQPLDIRSLILMTLTLTAFYLAKGVNKKMADSLLFQPLLLSMLIVIGCLWCYKIPYSDYLESNQLFRWLIGPAVVALAIPLHQNLQLIRQWLAPIIVVIVISIIATICLIRISADLVDIPLITQIALSTKSVTTPIALPINELLNGKKELAATLVMLTGITGAIFGPLILALIGIKDDRIKGVALGLTAHAIGTQKAFEISPTCGAFAALTMTLAGIIASLVLPFFVNMLLP